MDDYNHTDPPEYDSTPSVGHYEFSLIDYILYGSFMLICICGLLGNGRVIWLLGFRIKRNPFTTFVLNLAFADFGVLAGAVMLTTDFLLREKWSLLIEISLHVSLFMFCASQYTLTVISVDRCVSVFFPLWHRCHRPRHLSTIVCIIIWVVSLPPAAISISHYGDRNYKTILFWQLLLNGSLCLTFMTVSSLMLFIKVYCKLKQQRRQRTLTAILLTVFFFLFLSLPANGITIFEYWNSKTAFVFLDHVFFFLLCASLNGSVNPLIYYLVGRGKKGSSKKSMKAALQQLFKEEAIQRHVVENQAEAPL